MLTPPLNVDPEATMIPVLLDQQKVQLRCHAGTPYQQILPASTTTRGSDLPLPHSVHQPCEGVECQSHDRRAAPNRQIGGDSLVTRQTLKSQWLITVRHVHSQRLPNSQTHIAFASLITDVKDKR